jgi:hypothetical protein
MRLNCGESNSASLSGRTSRNTARIARTIDNVVVCRGFVRSILRAQYRPLMDHYRPHARVPPTY